MKIFRDYEEREVRLTDERLEHIRRRPEMENQLSKIEETVKNPDEVRKSDQDPTVYLYFKKYPNTPVTEKYLLVVIKIETESPFIITSFFTDIIRSGKSIFI